MSTLDVHQAAAEAKCHPDTLRKMAKAGEVPACKIGRAWVFPADLLDEWLSGTLRKRAASFIPRISDAQLVEAAEKIAAAAPPFVAISRPLVERKPGSYYASKRRAALLQRTPAWADREAILAVYAACDRISRETGILHHVDHEIPLQGAAVSGLHVESNLKVIEATANLQKRNRYEP